MTSVIGRPAPDCRPPRAECCAPAAASPASTSSIKEVLLVGLLREARDGNRSALEALTTALYPMIRRYVRARLADQWDPRTMACDVAQDAALRLLTSLGSCRATTNGEVIAWALGITRHALADVHRSPEDSAQAQRRTVSLDAAAGESAEMSADMPGEMSPSPARTPCLAAGHDTGGVVGTLPSTRRDAPETSAGRVGLRAVARAEKPTPSAKFSDSCAAAALSRVTDPLLRLVLVAYDALPADTATIFWSHLIGSETWAETGLTVGLTPGAAKRRYQRAQLSLRRHVLAALSTLPGPVRDAVQARLASGRRPRSVPAHSRHPRTETMF